MSRAPAPSVPRAFELRGASVSYGGVAALADAELAFSPGEAACLVGPSGAGKTTLLRLLCGAIRPTRGEVRVEGRDLATLAPAELRRVRARIGFVHQDLALVPNLRVSRNVIAGKLGALGFLASLRAMLLPSSRDLDRARGILERVGIGQKLEQRTDALSGGERQRVAIARALYQDPLAILADEPVSSVDPARARDTIALLVELAAERGLTLLVSLHDLELARAFFPRLVGLRDARVVFDLPTAAIDEGRFRSLYRLEERGSRAG
jgi:phosphonate transport system ATP-binding protein